MMNQRALIAASAFYTLFGMAVLAAPAAAPITRANIIQVFVDSGFSRVLFGVALVAAGLFSIASAMAQDSDYIRVTSAALRAGSMSGLAILELLLTLSTPQGNLIGMLVFTYLAVLSIISVPPPFPKPIEDAIRETVSARNRL